MTLTEAAAAVGPSEQIERACNVPHFQLCQTS